MLLLSLHSVWSGDFVAVCWVLHFLIAFSKRAFLRNGIEPGTSGVAEWNCIASMASGLHTLFFLCRLFFSDIYIIHAFPYGPKSGSRACVGRSRCWLCKDFELSGIRISMNFHRAIGYIGFINVNWLVHELGMESKGTITLLPHYNCQFHARLNSLCYDFCYDIELHYMQVT